MVRDCMGCMRPARVALDSDAHHYAADKPTEFDYVPCTHTRSAAAQHGGPVTGMSSHSVTFHGLFYRGNTDVMRRGAQGEDEGTPLIHVSHGGVVPEQGLMEGLRAGPRGIKDTRFEEGGAVPVCPAKAKTVQYWRANPADPYVDSHHEQRASTPPLVRARVSGSLARSLARSLTLLSNEQIPESLSAWASCGPAMEVASSCFCTDGSAVSGDMVC